MNPHTKRKHDLYVPLPEPPAPDPLALERLADQVLAGEVVQTGSVGECCALLKVLGARGYELKRRTINEQQTAPWLLLVTPAEVHSDAAP